MRAGSSRSDGSVGAGGSSLVATSRRRGRSASAGGRSDSGSDRGRNNSSDGSGLGGARNGQGDGSVDYSGGVDNGAGGRGLRSSGQGGGRAAAGGHNGAGRALRGRQSEGRRLSIDDTLSGCVSILGSSIKHQVSGLPTYVLLASGVTNEGTALPALGNTARRRVSGNVVRAAARSANAVGVAADDDAARKAVVGVGLGAGHLVGALGRSLSAGQSGGGGDDDGGGSHFECDFLFACLLCIYRYNGCEGDIKILGGCRYWCKWLSDEREYSSS